MAFEILDNLTRRDKDILHILWDSEEPMTASQIVSAEEGLTMNTVQAVLRKLLKNELIEVDQIVYSGKVLSRSYRPVMSEADFEISRFCGRYGKMKKRFPVSSMMQALFGSVDPSEIKEDEINELEAMIEEFRKKNIQ